VVRGALQVCARRILVDAVAAEHPLQRLDLRLQRGVGRQPRRLVVHAVLVETLVEGAEDGARLRHPPGKVVVVAAVWAERLVHPADAERQLAAPAHEVLHRRAHEAEVVQRERRPARHDAAEGASCGVDVAARRMEEVDRGIARAVAQQRVHGMRRPAVVAQEDGDERRRRGSEQRVQHRREPRSLGRHEAHARIVDQSQPFFQGRRRRRVEAHEEAPVGGGLRLDRADGFEEIFPLLNAAGEQDGDRLAHAAGSSTRR
jgi:hypothetical protein